MCARGQAGGPGGLSMHGTAAAARARTDVELALARVGLLHQDVGRRALDEPAVLARDVGHHHAQAIMQVLAALELNLLARAVHPRGRLARRHRGCPAPGFSRVCVPARCWRHHDRHPCRCDTRVPVVFSCEHDVFLSCSYDDEKKNRGPPAVRASDRQAARETEGGLSISQRKGGMAAPEGGHAPSDKS